MPVFLTFWLRKSFKSRSLKCIALYHEWCLFLSIINYDSKKCSYRKQACYRTFGDELTQKRPAALVKSKNERKFWIQLFLKSFCTTCSTWRFFFGYKTFNLKLALEHTKTNLQGTSFNNSDNKGVSTVYFFGLKVNLNLNSRRLLRLDCGKSFLGMTVTTARCLRVLVHPSMNIKRVS